MKTDTTIIRELFKKETNNSRNIYYYNDKRVNGRRRVFKSLGYSDYYKLVWRNVLRKLKRMGIDGWELYSGECSRGDGSVWGVKKHSRNSNTISV